MPIHGELDTLHQLGDANPKTLGENLQHGQTNILFPTLDFRNVSAIYAEAIGHLDLGQTFLQAQLPDSLPKFRCDLAGHAPIVRCRLSPTYRLLPTGFSKSEVTVKQDSPGTSFDSVKTAILRLLRLAVRGESLDS